MVLITRLSLKYPLRMESRLSYLAVLSDFLMLPIGNVNSVKISPNNFASIRIEDSYDCKIRLRHVKQEIDYVLEESAFTLNPSSAESDADSNNLFANGHSFSEVTKNLALEISIGSAIYLNTTVIEIIDRYLVHNQTVFELDVTFTLSSF